MLAEKTPAGFVAFDLLALGDESYVDRPFAERRAALEEALAGLDRAVLPDPDHDRPGRRPRSGSPSSRAPGSTAWSPSRWARRTQQNARTMLKIKHERTADVVVAGYREHKTCTPERPLLGSLLLGLYADGGSCSTSASAPASPRSAAPS